MIEWFVGGGSLGFLCGEGGSLGFYGMGVSQGPLFFLIEKPKTAKRRKNAIWECNRGARAAWPEVYRYTIKP